MKVTCKTCQVEFDKVPSEIRKSKSGYHFCSRSCAAAFNNRQPRLRRQPEGKCFICGCRIVSSRKYCDACYKVHAPNAPMDIDGLTKLELSKHSNYHQKIRVDSRRKKLAADPNVACVVCGYSTFVEVAHIRPVASFPDTALISEINDPTNLVYLCPNHHKEYDRGLIKLPSEE